VRKEFEGNLNFDYFSAWHRRNEMSQEGFHRSMITHRDRFLELVRNPPSAKEAANLVDRRITQGTRGEAGRRYHERMWTMIATCKKQNRSIFSFLQESITAKLAGQPAPSLLR
jgi:hypothetical protein